MTDNYSNVNGFIVIQADARDASVSWRHHRERGSLGGVDCVAPAGTPIYAPADCRLDNIPNNGSGGNTIRLTFADGWRDEMMHLSRFVAAGSKRKGELVGYSGDTGAPGQPHVHWHRIDPAGYYPDQWGSTNRRNPWHYFTNSSTAGGESRPLDPPQRKWPTMNIKYDTGGTGFLITDDGVTGVSAQEANLVERVVNGKPIGGPSDDPFLRSEMGILDDALKRAADGPRNF